MLRPRGALTQSCLTRRLQMRDWPCSRARSGRPARVTPRAAPRAGEGEARSVEGQVQALLQEAADPDRLCRMYVGWAPWL